jgi:hypothetical protein
MGPTKTCAILAAVAALAGCGESGRLRVDGQIAQTSSALASPDGTTLQIGDGTLVIDRARILVSEIEFEGGKEDEREAELGSAVIELALDGGPTTVAVESVEAGSYHTLGLELRGGDRCILVTGTYDGTRFTFTSGLSPELEFPLRPQVVVPPDGEAAVAVTFDLAAWFTDASGAVLDPTDGANQGAIERRILSSMAAYAEIEQEDDD